MKSTTYLLITIVIMHFVTLINITFFEGNYNGIVMAMNTFFLILAFGLVLSAQRKTVSKD